jgi:hypothetical protein
VGIENTRPLEGSFMALTIREIDTAKPTIKQYKLADSKGLCLLVVPSGAKLWRWRYRFEGKEKMMAFGEYPEVGLKEARELHSEARKQWSAGIDPMAERKAEVEAKQNEERSNNVRRRTASNPSPAIGGNGGLLASPRVMQKLSCSVWKPTYFRLMATKTWKRSRL